MDYKIQASLTNFQTEHGSIKRYNEDKEIYFGPEDIDAEIDDPITFDDYQKLRKNIVFVIYAFIAENTTLMHSKIDILNEIINKVHINEISTKGTNINQLVNVLVQLLLTTDNNSQVIKDIRINSLSILATLTYYLPSIEQNLQSSNFYDISHKSYYYKS